MLVTLIHRYTGILKQWPPFGAEVHFCILTYFSADIIQEANCEFKEQIRMISNVIDF